MLVTAGPSPNRIKIVYMMIYVAIGIMLILLGVAFGQFDYPVIYSFFGLNPDTSKCSLAHSVLVVHPLHTLQHRNARELIKNAGCTITQRYFFVILL